nr:MAG TPA: hypothetical protein [Caudoviricetes sp.]
MYVVFAVLRLYHIPLRVRFLSQNRCQNSGSLGFNRSSAYLVTL